MCVNVFSRVQFLVTSWTVACQASLSMEFPRQKYWSGLPFPSLGDFPNRRIKLVSPAGRQAGGFLGRKILYL